MSALVISEFYAGGGATSSAIYDQNYIELHNSGAQSVDLTNYSLQYASAQGDSWRVITLTGQIEPGGYYLVALGTVGLNGAALPTPDLIANSASGSTLRTAGGKIALVNGVDALSGLDPTGSPNVVDFVGYGPLASAAEGGAPAPWPSATLSDQRADGGSLDTDNNANDFVLATPDPQNSASPPSCFCAGSGVLTDRGKVAVEDLARGDLVITADGAAKPIVWIARRTVAARFADPVRHWPVRVKAGALAVGVPERDLRLSPDHALLVGGVLIHAGALVNGTSILRETCVPSRFVYYHIELDDHALVLVENVPAETFVDNLDRMAFDNGAEHAALFPRGRPIAELPLPRAKSRRQVPMRIWAALEARAEAICGSIVRAA